MRGAFLTLSRDGRLNGLKNSTCRNTALENKVDSVASYKSVADKNEGEGARQA